MIKIHSNLIIIYYILKTVYRICVFFIITLLCEERSSQFYTHADTHTSQYDFLQSLIIKNFISNSPHFNNFVRDNLVGMRKTFAI